MDREGKKAMRELVNSFAQLAAIIMILVTLAVSTAAISQWSGTDSAGGGSQTLQSQAALSSSAR
jgi:hypothetical protein